MSTFVRRVGTKIHDLQDKPFLLQGVGIGGWLLLEGYMVRSFDKMDRPRRFYEHLVKHIGKNNADNFIQIWQTEFFTKKDIIQIKEAGFNSIRIPFDYQVLFEASTTSHELYPKECGFRLLDYIIQCCKEQELFVILDLHGAPGGQTGTNIDNSEYDKPELFTNKLYQDQTVYIWRFLADRYKDEKYIAAYDLMNEPLPKWFDSYNDQVVPLYKRIIKAIRSVDANHMITVEGVHWATNWDIFEEVLDDNILYQFHKYWNNPDTESLEPYLTFREKYQVPIFMGEGGENNPLWYSAVFKLYDQHDISYNFWTYKKMSNTNSVVSFKEPSKWQDFLKGSLSTFEAIEVVKEVLKAIQFKNSSFHLDVVNHILNKDAFTIPAYAYDFYGKDISFKKISHKKSSLRVEDGLCIANQHKKIIAPNFKQYNGELVPYEETLYLHLEKDEFVTYTVNRSSNYVYFTVICSNSNYMEVSIDNNVIKSKDNYYGSVITNNKTSIRIKANNNISIKEIQFLD